MGLIFPENQQMVRRAHPARCPLTFKVNILNNLSNFKYFSGNFPEGAAFEQLAIAKSSFLLSSLPLGGKGQVRRG